MDTPQPLLSRPETPESEDSGVLKTYQTHPDICSHCGPHEHEENVRNIKTNHMVLGCLGARVLESFSHRTNALPRNTPMLRRRVDDAPGSSFFSLFSSSSFLGNKRFPPRLNMSFLFYFIPRIFISCDSTQKLFFNQIPMLQIEDLFISSLIFWYRRRHGYSCFPRKGKSVGDIFDPCSFESLTDRNFPSRFETAIPLPHKYGLSFRPERKRGFSKAPYIY